MPVEDDDVVPVLGADDAQRLGDLLVVNAQVAHVVRGGEPDAGAPTGPQVQCVELEAGVEVGLRQVGLEEVVAAPVQVEDRARVTRPAGPTGRLALVDEYGVIGAGRLRGRLGHRDAARHPRLAKDVGCDHVIGAAGDVRGPGGGARSGEGVRGRRLGRVGGPGLGWLGGRLRLRLGGGLICGRAHRQIQTCRPVRCEQRRRYATWE